MLKYVTTGPLRFTMLLLNCHSPVDFTSYEQGALDVREWMRMNEIFHDGAIQTDSEHVLVMLCVIRRMLHIESISHQRFTHRLTHLKPLEHKTTECATCGALCSNCSWYIHCNHCEDVQ